MDQTVRIISKKRLQQSEELRAAARLRQEVVRSEKGNDNMDRELAELKRKVGVLEERMVLYKSKSEETEGLRLKIQVAETRLQRKERKLQSLHDQARDSQVLTLSEGASVTQQLHFLSEKNAELKKASLVWL
ncbi:MAG: hypothetical protein P4M11_10285 [Candidatus Pacebacteria bacterium]|nr:hypothetical protein [Candidatus Paceibacterota bacterium]